MQFIEFKWESDRYKEAVELRDRLLRQPLGLQFTDEQLAEESSQFHFGLIDHEQLVACVIVARLSKQRAKLRQMAVDGDQQRGGVGTQLVREVEAWLRDRGYETVELHAREVVIGFYQSLGYDAEGERFTEVGIPHRKMVKSLPSAHR